MPSPRTDNERRITTWVVQIMLDEAARTGGLRLDVGIYEEHEDGALTITLPGKNTIVVRPINNELVYILNPRGYDDEPDEEEDPIA